MWISIFSLNLIHFTKQISFNVISKIIYSFIYIFKDLLTEGNKALISIYTDSVTLLNVIK